MDDEEKLKMINKIFAIFMDEKTPSLDAIIILTSALTSVINNVDFPLDKTYDFIQKIADRMIVTIKLDREK